MEVSDSLNEYLTSLRKLKVKLSKSYLSDIVAQKVHVQEKHTPRVSFFPNLY